MQTRFEIEAKRILKMTYRRKSQFKNQTNQMMSQSDLFLVLKPLRLIATDGSGDENEIKSLVFSDRLGFNLNRRSFTQRGQDISHLLKEKACFTQQLTSVIFKTKIVSPLNFLKSTCKQLSQSYITKTKLNAYNFLITYGVFLDEVTILFRQYHGIYLQPS